MWQKKFKRDILSGFLVLSGTIGYLMAVAQAPAQPGRDRQHIELKPYEISGALKGEHTGYLYLRYQSGPMSTGIDSALVRNGRFLFKGSLPHAVSATIMAENYRQYSGKEDAGTIFIEPGKMKLSLVKGDFKSAKLTGSKAQEDGNRLAAINAEATKKLEPFSRQFDEGNDAYIAAMRAKKDDAILQKMKNDLEEIKNKMEPYQDQIQSNTINFIKKNPRSWVSVYNLQFYASRMKVEDGERVYAQMPEEIRESFYGKELKKDLDGMRMGSPGSIAHVFSRKDINGEQLNLADYKGKYILIDFWASWCVPCRKGNPHLKSLYAKYKDKGFEIIGVSDDDNNEAAWKKAVEQDGIGIWKHVLRGLNIEKAMKGEADPNDLSNYYGIHSLPTKILINPEGVIIGRYGGGGENDEAMDKKLKEVLSGNAKLL